MVCFRILTTPWCTEPKPSICRDFLIEVVPVRESPSPMTWRLTLLSARQLLSACSEAVMPNALWRAFLIEDILGRSEVLVWREGECRLKGSEEVVVI